MNTPSALRPLRARWRVRRCASCLFYEGMEFFLLRNIVPLHLLRSFHLGADGRCSICREYERTYSDETLARELAFLKEDAAARGAGSRPLGVVALSGGKDSLSSLYLARRVLKLPVVALLFQNGHIPAPVVRQAKKLCRSLEVELIVERGGPAFERDIRDRVAGVAPGSPSPCRMCSTMIHRALDRAMEERDLRWAFFGTNFFLSWTDRPHALQSRRIRADGTRDYGFNLPYALRLSRRETQRNLLRMGAREVGLKGISTNCRIPERVARRIGPVLGHVPELEQLSLEVMVGHLTRSQALRILRQKERGLGLG